MTLEIEIVDIHEAKQNLHRWIALAKEGVEVILTEEGEPLARILPVSPGSKRVPGLNRGDIEIADDFDDPLPEYDFSGHKGERGKYYQVYREGHIVRVDEQDNTTYSRTDQTDY